jgi:hypothetical protein
MALTPTPCRGTSYVPRQPQTRQAQVLLAGGARHRSRGSRGGRQGQLARSERVHRQRAGAQHAPRRRGRRTGARRTARVRKAAGGGDGRRAAVGRATAVEASAARAQAAGVRARDAARAQAATGEADDRGVSHGHREGGSFKWRGGAAGGAALGGWRGQGRRRKEWAAAARAAARAEPRPRARGGNCRTTPSPHHNGEALAGLRRRQTGRTPPHTCEGPWRI